MMNRTKAAGVLLTVVFGAGPLTAQQLKIAPDRKYVLIETILLRNLTKDLNAVAQQGFRLRLVTHRDSRPLAVMERTASEITVEYRVERWATAKSLNAAADEGFRVVPHTLQIELHFGTRAGESVDLVVLEKDPRETARYEYQVLQSNSASKLDMQIAQSVRSGWQLIDLAADEAILERRR